MVDYFFMDYSLWESKEAGIAMRLATLSAERMNRGGFFFWRGILRPRAEEKVFLRVAGIGKLPFGRSSAG